MNAEHQPLSEDELAEIDAAVTRGAYPAPHRVATLIRMLRTERTRAEKAEQDTKRLRSIIFDCAKAIGNGAFVLTADTDLVDRVPAEIEVAVKVVTNRAAAEWRRAEKAEAELRRLDIVRQSLRDGYIAVVAQRDRLAEALRKVEQHLGRGLWSPEREELSDQIFAALADMREAAPVAEGDLCKKRKEVDGAPVARGARFLDALDAGLAGQEWLHPIAQACDPIHSRITVEKIGSDGRATLLWTGLRLVAAFFLIRDSMNFTVLVKWLSAAEITPPQPIAENLTRPADAVQSAPRSDVIKVFPGPALTIHLTPAEIQSGHDRGRWAEGLILQLPEGHEGRNSWLLSYGRSDVAETLRTRWEARHERAIGDVPGRDPLPPDPIQVARDAVVEAAKDWRCTDDDSLDEKLCHALDVLDAAEAAQKGAGTP